VCGGAGTLAGAGGGGIFWDEGGCMWGGGGSGVEWGMCGEGTGDGLSSGSCGMESPWSLPWSASSKERDRATVWMLTRADPATTRSAGGT